MSFATSQIFPQKQSIAFVSPGDWGCPSVELSQPVYDVKAPTHTVVVEGTSDLDVGFFRAHGQGQWSSSPFCMTVALLSSLSMTPLDWNQERPSNCGMRQSTPNPTSCIKINPRVTVDEQLCCISFSIALPLSLIAQTPPPSQYQSTSPITPSSAPANTDPSKFSWREFGVAIKAYDASGRVTSTNIAQFLVRYPKSAVAASAAPSTPGGLARRVSNALHKMSHQSTRRRSSGGNAQAIVKQGVLGNTPVASKRDSRRRSVHSNAPKTARAFC
ncbi:hypothetical protein DL93DRAFT_2070095 [Clavulina sp. PMI_390]|nr:hypothetical protein DL93DRAFT_2070095 [Clavulina sp. PMI_390]